MGSAVSTTSPQCRVVAHSENVFCCSICSISGDVLSAMIDMEAALKHYAFYVKGLVYAWNRRQLIPTVKRRGKCCQHTRPQCRVVAHSENVFFYSICSISGDVLSAMIDMEAVLKHYAFYVKGLVYAWNRRQLIPTVKRSGSAVSLQVCC